MVLSRNAKASLVGVDIGTTSVKVVELGMRGTEVTVDNYKVVPLPEGVVQDKNILDQERLLSILATVLRGKAKKKPIAFAIPTSQSESHEVPIDDNYTPVDYVQFITNQGRQLINMPINEAYYDYRTFDGVVDGKRRKMLHVVAAPSTTVNDRSVLFESLGVEPKVATIERLAVEKTLPYLHPNAEGRAYIIADIGYSTTSYYLVNEGRIVYSNEYDRGGQALIRRIMDGAHVDYDQAVRQRDAAIENQDQEFIDQYITPFYEGISSDFMRFSTVVSTMRADASEATELLLCGGGAMLNGLVDYLKEKLSVGVRYASPFDNMAISPSIDRAAFEKDKPSLLTVCGLALCDSESLNLLPWRDELAQHKRNEYLGRAALAALLGGLMTFGVWSYYNEELDTHIAANDLVKVETSNIGNELETMREVTTLRDTMLKRMRLIENLEAQRPAVVAINNSVVSALPRDAYLTGYIKEGLNYEFQGKAKDAQTVAEFMRGLKATPWFKDIFMTSYIAYKPASKDEVLPPGELGYGEFFVTATIKGLTYESVLDQPLDTVAEMTISREGEMIHQTVSTVQIPTATEAQVPMDASTGQLGVQPGQKNIQLPPQVPVPVPVPPTASPSGSAVNTNVPLAGSAMPVAPEYPNKNVNTNVPLAGATVSGG